MLRIVILALASLGGLRPILAQKDDAGRSSKHLWSTIKASLVAPDGVDYFKENLKGTMLPGGAAGVTLFTATLLSAKPAEQPSVLVVAISDSTTPEVTLQIKDAEWKDTHLNGPLVRGSVIQFEGVGMSFTKEPFMLTLGVFVAKRSRSLKVSGKSR